MSAPLKPGDPVIVVGGLAVGLRGIVRDIAKTEWEPGVPMFAVELPAPMGLRVLRADYLKRSEVRP